jgi:NDP-sugar pyrophosphorylase family protein
MKAAIIAAGRGERLVAAGIPGPKPLVQVAGRPLLDHVLAALEAAGGTSVACVVNEESAGIEDHCRAHWSQLAFAFVRRTTPNSMESLFTLAPLLEGGRFLLLTVDAIFAPATLSRFLAAAANRPAADVVLGITAFVDDEKPLHVQVDAAGCVQALGDTARQSPWVTAGLYVIAPTVFAEIEAARRAGFIALREFLGHLVAGGYRVEAEAVGKCVDVDRPEDIVVAEAFIASGYAE